MTTINGIQIQKQSFTMDIGPMDASMYNSIGDIANDTNNRAFATNIVGNTNKSETPSSFLFDLKLASNGKVNLNQDNTLPNNKNLNILV